MSNKKTVNFFKVPHCFEEEYGRKLTPSGKYFYIILRKLANRYANSEGWFWHVDKMFATAEGNFFGFENFGFSPSTSKRARRKLKDLGLIEIKYSWNKFGHRAGTYYKLTDIDQESNET